MKRALKIAGYVVLGVLTVFVAVVCAVCVYTVVRKVAYGDDMPTVFGYAAATVATGSMEPTINQGDLVIIKAYDSYEEGDVITFYDSSFGGYITHRIVDIESGLYITQGDANDATDISSVAYSQVKGKVVMTIGGAGDFIEFLQTPAGIFCIIAFLGGIWLIFEIVGVVIKKVKEKKGLPDGGSDGPDGSSDGAGSGDGE